MTQTVLVRVEEFLKNLLPLAEQPSTEATRTPSGARPDDEDTPAEGRFSREEAYYWSMHAHW